MTKELRDLLRAEHVRVAESAQRATEESRQDELIERAIDRLMTRNNRSREDW